MRHPDRRNFGSGPTSRLFAAIFPPAEVIDELSVFLAPRQVAGPELRWSTPEQWHLTLAFMPAVPPACRDDLAERLERAGRRRRPMELQLGHVGVFPNPYEARVLFIAPIVDEQVHEELRRLATGARSAAARAGAAPTGGRFRPHLTIARSTVPFEATRWMKVIGTWHSFEWIADEFELVESRLGEGAGGRPEYTRVARFAIG